MKRTPLASLTRVISLAAIMVGMFAAGFWLRDTVPSQAHGNSPDIAPISIDQTAGTYPLLTQAQQLIQDHYLRPLPSPSALEYGAIRGMLGALNDRLTYFIEPPVAASESNVLAGQYGGIGVLVKRDEQGRFVLFPFRDGPAAKAGLQDGDVLIKINGADLPATTQIDAVDQMLRGEVKPGNGVKLVVQRTQGGQTQDVNFDIAFAVIEVPSVVWRVLAEEPTFGYIQILRFTARTPAELKTAIDDLRAANSGQGIRALVLDLRNNPGGLLTESIQVASQFVPDGTVLLYERNRSGEKSYISEKGGTITDLPMVILTNGGTASASELVAGALIDNKRAITIGQKSFGKFTVQLIFQLADKSSIHITTAEFYPPSKVALEGKGIEPTIAMIPDQSGRDVELGEAIRKLREQVATK